MSLYNQIFNYNECTKTLIEVLGLDTLQVGRFRDIYIWFDEATQVPGVAVFTRLGGVNREDHQENISYLESIEGYDGNSDDDFDSTYATWFYKVKNPEYRVLLGILSGLHDQTPPMEKFKTMMESMKEGDHDSPDVKKALEVGKEIFEKIETSPNGSTIRV